MKHWSGACLVLVFCLMNLSSKSQNDLFTKLNFRSTGTYLNDWRREWDLRYKEIIWNTQVATSLTKSLYFGMQASVIFTSGNTIESENYTAWGPFIQYDFFPEKDYRIYLESSYIWSDYCTCAQMPEEYYRLDVNYFGLGAGFDKHLGESNFFLSISVIFQEIMGKITEEQGFNYYRIGVGYDFGKK